jgi:hypothetical protein
MNILKIYLFLVLLIANGIAAGQTTITLKPLNGAGKDAVIVTMEPDTNFMMHPDLVLSTWSCGSQICLGRGLIQFDLSSIPSNSLITSATLNLYADSMSSNGVVGQPTYGTANAGFIRRITQAWSESTVTWNNEPAYTTLHEAILPQSTAITQNYSTDVTSLVQDMINDTANSHGFLLMEQNETTYYNSLIFGSSDNTDTSIAPELIITYTGNCLTLQPDSSGKDAVIVTTEPDTNFADHPDYLGSTWFCNSVLCLGRGLLDFDLSAIPAGAGIASATLYLYADTNSTNGVAGQPTYGTSNAGFIRRITQPWDEHTVTWNNQPSYSTVNEVQLPQSTGPLQDYTADVTNLVQDMINNPANSFGFLLMEQNETTYYNSLIFGSGDNSQPAIHPKLDVCFIPVGIRETVLATGLFLYPNPAGSVLYLKRNAGMQVGTVTVRIFNSLGMKIMEKKVSGNSPVMELSLGDVPPGVFAIQVIGSGVFFNSKFIRQ